MAALQVGYLDAVDIWPSGDARRQRDALGDVLPALRAGRR
jgi:hypothetical protein